MSEHDHHPDAAIAPESELEGAYEHGRGDGAEHGPEHAPKKAPRFPFAHRSKGGVAKWKRETRFGVAALLSFVILVSVLLVNKGTKKGTKPPPLAMGNPAAEAPSPDSSSSKSKSDPAANKDKDKDR